MALTDLIIDQSQITTDLIENVLKGRVSLVRESKGVYLSQESARLGTKVKLLLFLAGKRAWELIDGTGERFLSSLDEMGKETGVHGSTLRGALKDLKDAHLVDSENAKYFVLPKGMHTLTEWLKDGSAESTPKSHGKAGGAGKSKISGRAGGGRAEILEAIKTKPFSEEVVTRMLPILRRVGNQDKYLLAIYMAKQEMEINGLVPAEVNYLLTEPPIGLPSKFYVSNISRDLGSKLRDYVNPYRAGKAHEYRLNTPGREYVESLINSNA